MTGKTGKGLSIGAAMKSRMKVQEPVEDTPAVPAPAVEGLEPFNTRLRAGLHRRLKLHAAGEGLKIQEVVNEALEAYLSQKESK